MLVGGRGECVACPVMGSCLLASVDDPGSQPVNFCCRYETNDIFAPPSHINSCYCLRMHLIRSNGTHTHGNSWTTFSLIAALEQ